MKRCTCCGKWIGPLVILSSTSRVACPSCWAIFRVNMGAAFGVGVIVGALGVATLMLVFGSGILSDPRGMRIVLLPWLFGFLVGKLFPVMELEEPPTDRG